LTRLAEIHCEIFDPMLRHNVLVGGTIVLLCALLLPKERWLLEKTAKGQRLIHWFGPGSAVWVLRGLIAAGMIFGGLLAAEIIRPVQW